MRNLIRSFILQHDLLAPGDRVLVAVSGGADSVALLRVLWRLAPDFGLTLVAAHLDHALRPESGGDANFVAELCASLGVPLETSRMAVAELAAATGQGLEEAGRDARRRFLLEVAAARGCRLIALGHHRNDQAETVLLRLLRGSGASGLAAMRPRRGPFIRPLLGVTGDALRDFLRQEGVGWVDDASNVDPTFTRNRIRHQLLPLLMEFNPAIIGHLAALSERLGQEEDYWDRTVAAALEELSTVSRDGLVLAVPALRELHPALRIRLLREAVCRVRGDLRRIAACHLEALDRMVLEEGPQSAADLPGLWAGRRYQQLRLQRAAPHAIPAFSLIIDRPGRFLLPDGRTLVVERGLEVHGEDPWTVEFDGDRVPWPMTVRPFRAGDRIRLPGEAGRHPVKELFRAARLTLEERCQLPLVFADELLWVPGLRRFPGRVAQGGGTVLRLHLTGALEVTKAL